MKNITKLVLLSGLLAGSTGAGAEALPFDGSKTLLCATRYVSQCDAGADCVNVTPESVDVPGFFVVDAVNKLITGTPESGTEATTQIERSEVLDGRLILQGADDGIADVRDGIGWTMAIDEVNGKMVLTGSGDGYATIVFGACTVR
jgi:hypothetical protein